MSFLQYCKRQREHRTWNVKKCCCMLNRSKKFHKKIRLWISLQTFRNWCTDWDIIKDNDDLEMHWHKRFSWFFNHKMKKFCQIDVLTLAILITASSFNCLSIATVTVTFKDEHFTSISSFVSITSASHSVNITNINDSVDYMTISITNVYKSQ